MTSSNLPRRIIKETQRLLNEPANFNSPGISASPSEENMHYFNVMILGPAQSPYEACKHSSVHLILMVHFLRMLQNIGRPTKVKLLKQQRNGRNWRMIYSSKNGSCITNHIPHSSIYCKSSNWQLTNGALATYKRSV